MNKTMIARINRNIRGPLGDYLRLDGTSLMAGNIQCNSNNILLSGGSLYIDSDNDTRIYDGGADETIVMDFGGTEGARFNQTYLIYGQTSARAAIVNSAAPGTGVAIVLPRRSDSGTGVGWVNNNILGMVAGNVDAAQFDTSAVANDTRMLLYCVHKGALARVSTGANDTGGAGFRLLRVPN